tara:strand:- start:2970 stop:3182 length:213 start_codon:yes stop_codon:yes gene_type:complete
MKELTGLQKFARELLCASFEGCDFDGEDIQQLALKHKLTRVESYDEEIHHYCEGISEGDDYHCFNDVLEK